MTVRATFPWVSCTMFKTLAPKMADLNVSLESTLSYVLIPYVRAGQLPFYTCPNIPEAPLRGRMDTRIWRDGMGCLYSTQLPKDSGCRRLLRLPGWHHRPGADGEGTQRTKAEIMYCTPLALIRGWLELGHVTIYNTKEVGMCSFSGCPGRGENMGGSGAPDGPFQTPLQLLSRDQETFWRGTLEKFPEDFQIFKCAFLTWTC